MRGEFHMSEFEDKLRSIPGLSPFIDSGFIKVGDTMTTLPDQLTVDQLGFLPDIDTLECVSKCREMQFRVDLPAFQGDFPQA